jgi:hypothetical protein
MKIKQRGITGIIVGSVMILIYIVLHLNIAWYNDTRIWVFALAPVGEVRSSYGCDALTLKPAILNTPYGNIEMPIFTKIGYNNGSHSSFINFIVPNNRLKHNIVIYGNKMNVGSIFKFYKNKYLDRANNQDAFAGAYSKQKAILGNHTLGIEKVNTIKKDNYEELEFILIEVPDILYLSDGTEISTIYMNGTKPPSSLKIKNDGKWFFGLEDGGLTFPIKKPTDTDYTYYEDISFKENWGDFIGGTKADEWR